MPVTSTGRIRHLLCHSIFANCQHGLLLVVVLCKSRSGFVWGQDQSAALHDLAAMDCCEPPSRDAIFSGKKSSRGNIGPDVVQSGFGVNFLFWSGEF